MEKKWDTITPVDLKRFFLSGAYMSHWSRKGLYAVSSRSMWSNSVDNAKHG